MGLNLQDGEKIAGIGGPYRLAKREYWVATNFYEEARRNAIAAFVASGALLPVIIDPDSVLIQEYSLSNRLAFIFQRYIAGKDHYYPYTFTLPLAMVSELRVTGHWGDDE